MYTYSKLNSLNWSLSEDFAFDCGKSYHINGVRSFEGRTQRSLISISKAPKMQGKSQIYWWYGLFSKLTCEKIKMQGKSPK